MDFNSCTKLGDFYLRILSLTRTTNLLKYDTKYRKFVLKTLLFCPDHSP